MVLEAAMRGPQWAGVVGISGYLPTLSRYPEQWGSGAGDANFNHARHA